MNHSITHIEKNLITIQGQQVLLDRYVAELYGVETKRINEAVKNNLDKFPADYLIELSKREWNDLRSKISTANFFKNESATQSLYGKGFVYAGYYT